MYMVWHVMRSAGRRNQPTWRRFRPPSGWHTARSTISTSSSSPADCHDARVSRLHATRYV